MAVLMKVLGPGEEPGTLKGELYPEDVQTAELYEHVGFAHVPEEGAEGLMLLVENHAGHQVLLSPRRPELREALGLSPGETAFYSTKEGKLRAQVCAYKDGKVVLKNEKLTVTLTNDGSASIDNGSGKFELRADGTMALNGDGKSFVTHADLDTGLQAYVAKIETRVATLETALGLTPVPTPLDISAAKTTTVKTGG